MGFHSTATKSPPNEILSAADWMPTLPFISTRNRKIFQSLRRTEYSAQKEKERMENKSDISKRR